MIRLLLHVFSDIRLLVKLEIAKMLCAFSGPDGEWLMYDLACALFHLVEEVAEVSDKANVITIAPVKDFVTDRACPARQVLGSSH